MHAHRATNEGKASLTSVAEALGPFDVSNIQIVNHNTVTLYSLYCTPSILRCKGQTPKSKDTTRGDSEQVEDIHIGLSSLILHLNGNRRNCTPHVTGIFRYEGWVGRF